MMPEFATLPPLFVGPTGFLLSSLLLIVLILVVARLVFGLAWKLVKIAAVVLLVFWLLGVIGSGPGILGSGPGILDTGPGLNG